MFNSYTRTTLRHNPELCDNCGLCIAVCPHAAFFREGRTVRVADAARCMECGACQQNCQAGAVTVDSGVGCAAAMMRATLLRRPEASCR